MLKGALNVGFINGTTVEGADGSFEVNDPATNESVGMGANFSTPQVNDAIAAAQFAFKEYSSLPASERANILRRVSELLWQKRDALAPIMSLESGKPLAESVGEVSVPRRCLPTHCFTPAAVRPSSSSYAVFAFFFSFFFLSLSLRFFFFLVYVCVSTCLHVYMSTCYAVWLLGDVDWGYVSTLFFCRRPYLFFCRRPYVFFCRLRTRKVTSIGLQRRPHAPTDALFRTSRAGNGK